LFFCRGEMRIKREKRGREGEKRKKEKYNM
jgi:hypothetical protein